MLCEPLDVQSGQHVKLFRDDNEIFYAIGLKTPNTTNMLNSFWWILNRQVLASHYW
ncbi:protein of unknown function [Legionella fallonii LLAP-10]|uniref:Uncharacterized protein n=1 Tax=Legionella fallonii LLAP-10 TaxID=1212491 RepID=A0A098G0V0_9GAMM|nr:protein of unknown function [Legionella fallonii LLAP-10]